MSVTPNRLVLLFAGQGSHQHLTNPAHVRAMTELLLDEHLDAFWDFLRQCREVFHIELQSVSDEERSTLEGSLKDAFQEAESFLSPPEAFRSHPVVETLSLYTHQVLELMLFQSHNECKTGTDGAYGDARILGIFGSKNISICGSNSRLNDIKSKLAAGNIDYRWANGHAVYHGGDQMQHILQNTLNDVERRGIEFPNWDMLHIPLWSATDGSQNSELKTKGKTLLDAALRSIFIDMVDWRTTSNKILDFHLKNLDTSSTAKVCLTVIGPGSKMLFHSYQVLKHPNLDMIESCFDYMSMPSSDDMPSLGYQSITLVVRAAPVSY
ncbi:hypothetical protein TrVFT333_007058 [Trichoderma virens FT-333]|nr:hypothetical protein TrVFT333_007058 [Trichoderma virens FT-333]